MQSIIEFWNKLPKYKQPSCKSFVNIKKAVTDPLSEEKISYFSFICSLSNPTRKNFRQSSQQYPLFTLTNLLRNLSWLVVKPDVLNICNTGLQMTSIDLYLKENLLSLSDVELGFGVKAIITKAKMKDTVISQEVAKFKRKGQRFVTSVVKNLFEKSPIKCEFVRFCSIFDHVVILKGKYSRNDLNHF